MKSEQLEFFEKRYEAMDSEDLIDLYRKRTLMPEAEAILLRILEGRGISEERRDEISNALKGTSYEEKIQRFASVGSRFWARLLDIFIALMATTIVTWLLLYVDAGPNSLWISVAVFLSYSLFSDSLPGGRSIGKKMNGIAVISKSDGRPCSIGQSFVRNFGLLTIGIIDVALVLGDERQRIGDRLAGTEVVKIEYLRDSQSIK